jgi:micrococcal nuclease
VILGAALIAAALRSAGDAGPPQARPDAPPQAVSAADARPAVTRVIDGDTVGLSDGRTVRYIGIDTPESRRRVNGRWVNDPEPYSRAATEANRLLVQGKAVRLEYDVQPEDRYGRTLAYVYVAGADGRELMANEELLRQGMAQLLTIPPNVRHVERFRAAADEARRSRRGLWGAAGAR